jgi:hypothetical protein
MPSLIPPHDYLCYHCGAPANFVSFNAKKYRCNKSANTCPGVIQKMKKSREQNTTPEQQRAHMKLMSQRGNAKIANLMEDTEWLSQKVNKFKETVRSRGGRCGSKNSMYGKKHSPGTKAVMSKIAHNRSPEFYENMVESRICNGTAIPKHLLSAKELYEEEVYRVTYNSWQKFQDKINPTRLPRGKDYELDHIYSVAQGLIDMIPPEIIGHWCNLRVIPMRDNRAKRMKCDITLAELYEKIKTSGGG